MTNTQIRLDLERNCVADFNEFGELPYYMRDGVVGWVVYGRMPGEFLSAVICNDLGKAAGHADHSNRRCSRRVAASEDRGESVAARLHRHGPRSRIPIRNQLRINSGSLDATDQAARAVLRTGGEWGIRTPGRVLTPTAV